MKSLLERLRSRRLASVFVLLATLSAAIVAGSFAAHGVRGQEKQNDSADATPLKVVNSTVPPNDFVRIARLVGPAVVNINTQTLPKQSENRGRRNPHGRLQPVPQNPGGDDQDQVISPAHNQGQLYTSFSSSRLTGCSTQPAEMRVSRRIAWAKWRSARG